MKKLIEWFKSSNHYKHTAVGFILYLITLVLASICSAPPIGASLISLFLVFSCMASVEYKDKLYGNKFDWEDILAGMICPVIITLIIILTGIFTDDIIWFTYD